MSGHEDSTEDILQAALLNQAFSPPPSRRQSVQPAVPSSTGAAVETTPADLATPIEDAVQESESTDESWKAEYESQVESWRAQSSEAREKAEKERERWEALRAAEKEEAARRKAMGIVDEPAAESPPQEADWETVSNRKTGTAPESSIVSSVASPSVADSRDLVTGESEHQYTAPANNAGASANLPRSHSQADTGDDSQKWEDIQASVTSSFPSMSYPERTETPSPSRQHPAPPPPAPLSATLAIFDPTLSTRTRVTAFFSSLAINMLLPFVNGVMLGFGEIFAKNVVMGWFGWKPSGPGSVATTAGINGTSKTPWGQRQKQKQT